MTYASDNVVIVGLGLIGGSLARALRISGFSQRFIGYGHREASLKRGVELGVIDEFTLDLDEAIERADIVVVCTPTLTTVQMLEKILPRLRGRGRGPVVTDVASVKGNLRNAAIGIAGVMPPQLVLGHPIAGSERSGVSASDGELFVNHRVILTPDAANDPAAVELVRAMWRSAGADVVDMTVEQHDAVLASTSHLPHVLAYTLVDALASADNSGDIFRSAAGGFRDFTRIASSDPAMWRDIAIANKSALLDSIDLFSNHLAQLRQAVQDEKADELFNTFDRAKQARNEFATLLAQRIQPKPS
ncbi:MAG: prephenate dehydrogenase/arogenate dehydrogenase family protein [Halioglobus sp.]|nr:prephenate dehydrogenase/arogenate dehydrogenase family protein [Halioglobus sp.]